MADKAKFDQAMHNMWAPRLLEYRGAAETIQARHRAEAEAEINALTVKVQGGIVAEYLRLKAEGNYYAKGIVCKSVGISKPTLDNWIKKLKHLNAYSAIELEIDQEHEKAHEKFGPVTARRYTNGWIYECDGEKVFSDRYYTVTTLKFDPIDPPAWLTPEVYRSCTPTIPDGRLNRPWSDEEARSRQSAIDAGVEYLGESEPLGDRPELETLAEIHYRREQENLELARQRQAVVEKTEESVGFRADDIDLMGY